MAKEVSIVVRVKNAVTVGLSKIGKELQDFGQSAMRIGKFFATGFMAAGTAIAGFALKAITAYAEAEAAQRSLEGALRANGDEVAVNTARVQQFAAEIQNETGVSDDNLVARAARLRMLGVEAGSLEAATKATVALKSAGMDEEAAIKAVAMAHAGNYSQLSRYIPQLKNATSEADKARIVNEFLAKGYAQQKDNLNSVSGQWGLLKERVGDVCEVIGGAIMQNEALSGVLSRVSEGVKKFGEAIQQWISGGGIVNAIAVIKGGLANIAYGFELTGNTMSMVWAAIGDATTTLFVYMGGIISGSVAVWQAEFVYFKDVAVAAWEAIKHPIEKGFVAPSTEPIKAALDDLAQAYKNTDNKITDQKAAAIAARDEIERAHVVRLGEIEVERSQKYKAQVDKRLEDEKIQLAASLKNNKATAEGIARIQSDLTESLANEQSNRTKIDAVGNDQVGTKLTEEQQQAFLQKLVHGTTKSTSGKSASPSAALDFGNWGGDSIVTAIGQSRSVVQGPGAFQNVISASGLNNPYRVTVQGSNNFPGYSFASSTGRTNAEILEELRKIRVQNQQLLRLG